MDEREQKKQDKPTAAHWKEKTVRFFEHFGLREERKLLRTGKILILGLILFMAALILLQLFTGGVETWRKIVAGSVLTGLTIAETLKLFVVKKPALKVVCYVADFLFIFTLVAATGSSYMPVLYILALTEFYLSAKKMRASVLMFAISAPVYVGAYATAISIWQSDIRSMLTVGAQSIEALVILTLHFVCVNFLLGFYRQYLRLRQALKDLDESSARLKEAYAELEEVTVLEERQRIAKDIHDTAGHSITTVIMQTEAAKLIVDKDAAAAKQKIIAANLQAKHALEELRESVHLLSGSVEKPTLKTALLTIVAESTDGTDVKIRHDVDDVTVEDARYRYLCNTLKEGISNGLRHGGATAFYLEVKEREDAIEFLLSDNGKGMKREDFQEGFGLSGMKKGVEGFGGQMSVYTEPDEGFEIRLTLPNKDEEKKDADD